MRIFPKRKTDEEVVENIRKGSNYSNKFVMVFFCILCILYVSIFFV